MSSSNTLSEYRALRKVLTDNLELLDKEMEKAGLPDLQVTKAQLHPTDAPNYSPSQELFDARRNAMEASFMLFNTLKSPAEAISEDVLSHWFNVAMELASHTKLIELLLPAGEAGVTTTDLGKGLGINPVKLAKLLRILAAHFYLVEVEEDRFAVSRKGLLLAPGSPLRNIAAWQTWFSFHYSTETLRNWQDPAKTDSWKALDTAAADAYKWAEQGYEDLWDWGVHRHPEKIQQFAQAMGAVSASGVVDAYDWTAPDDGLLVDVGGSVGKVVQEVLLRHPKLKAVVQDRQELQQSAEAFWQANLPAETVGRIKFEAYDFYTPQTQREAAFYILRFIMHDLDDERASIVLRNIVAAMGSKSKLIVIDFVIIPAVVAGSRGAEKTEEHRSVPYPLLYSTLTPYLALEADVEMVGVNGGTERTVKRARHLFEQAGLKVNRIINTRGYFGIYELTLP